MKRYLKLVNFEINRAIKLFAGLLVIIAVVEVAGVIIKSRSYLQETGTLSKELSVSPAEYIQRYGVFSFLDIITSMWILAPIALSAAAMLLYCFLIWYRDWYGKNTFIYRLLMLPTERTNIFFAKATAIALLVLGLVAFQIILFPLEQAIMEYMIPSDLLSQVNYIQILNSFWFLNLIIPDTLSVFLVSYGIGVLGIFILFTAILFERSYRLKGIFMGIGYIVIASALFLSPLLIMAIPSMEFMLYPMELLLLEMALFLAVTALSVYVSKFLLNKKVSV
ncbi:hypothetical protein CVD28_11865 [Bacillus sp. M6-12]|uniref:hypothetical protein n=1 Tax=Bacillus sp. M6-12 TaxID=2054166 RepID=UPI000C7852AD|nr:hypothetical protein [Bacillus sp. M6-12]PLS17260.1 hypothetical protein CVD28_11865 [Bacillus sp. M6-12]